MKRLLFILSMLLGVAYGQICADEDTVRSNSVSLITYNSARINGTTSHFSGSVSSLQLKYVRVGQTDTVTSSGSSALRNITGLQANTQYYYYYKSICGSGSMSQTIGAYTFTTLANNVAYTPMDAMGYQFKYLKVDTLLQFVPGDTSVSRGGTTNAAIKYKSSDNTFYGYYPNCACWRALAIDSSGIIGLLDGKVDSVTVSGDSLFYWKVGVSYGYILPALANTWRIIGNSGTDTSINFLGTSDNVPLKIRTNNTDRVIIGVDGSFTVDNSTGNNLTATSDSKMQVSTGTYDNAINIGESAVSISSSQTGFLNSASGITIYPDSIMLQPLQGALSIDTLTNLSSQNALIGWIQGSGQGRIGYVTIGAGLSLSSGALSFSGLTVGTTSVSSGSSNAFLYNSSGTLQNDANITRPASGTLAVGTAIGVGTTTPAAVLHTVGTVRMASMGTASTDTTTYKPMGISSLGDVIPMASWYGSGGGSSGLTVGTTSISSGTNDRILYQSGGVLQQSSNLVFNSSNELIIGGTDNGSAVLQVNGGTALFKGALEVNNHTFYNDANVAFTISDNSRSYLFNMYNNGNHVLSLSRAQGYMRLGPTIASTSAGVMFQVDARSATDKGLLIKGASSQSANLIEAQDNSSNVLFSVNQNGTVRSRNVIYQTINASDADFTAAVGTAYVLPDPSTGRTITLPTGQDADKILFYLPVSPSNSWNLSTNVTILDGSTVNKLDAYGPGAIYLIYDGANSVWRLIPNM